MKTTPLFLGPFWAQDNSVSFKKFQTDVEGPKKVPRPQFDINLLHAIYGVFYEHTQVLSDSSSSSGNM